MQKNIALNNGFLWIYVIAIESLANWPRLVILASRYFLSDKETVLARKAPQWELIYLPLSGKADTSPVLMIH